ncbi:MAG: DNA recombination protein RmuC [Coriobacteriaceae bacterium]|nr:DNA recombination protein RmuC [Coriobacteriaceae bacterium]
MNNSVLDVVALAAAALSVVICLVTLRRSPRGGEEVPPAFDEELRRRTERLEAGLSSMAQWANRETAVSQQRFEQLMGQMRAGDARMDEQRREMAGALERNRDVVDARLQEIRAGVDAQLDAVRRDNQEQLDRMREVVDQKLTHTLNDRLSSSFKQVSDQLESVYTGLGDMRSIAAGVGDLKRVLANVKTRGILGEVQLGAILSDILAPSQYAQNVAVRPGSSERVEYAVRIPQEGAEPLWLPIDSKFPGDAYEAVQRALEAGDAGELQEARRVLERRLRDEAADIRAKYVAPPATTNFGILFLPFEGLYAEVVDRPGLIEGLMRDYQVSVAGPSTMAAILNSLQMSYQSFAFQRRADEIQQVLSAVKAEFPKYQSELRRALKQIETAGRTVDTIINTRTNVIERTLRDVTDLDASVDGEELLGIDAPLSVDGEVE